MNYTSPPPIILKVLFSKLRYQCTIRTDAVRNNLCHRNLRHGGRCSGSDILVAFCLRTTPVGKFFHSPRKLVDFHWNWLEIDAFVALVILVVVALVMLAILVELVVVSNAPTTQRCGRCSSRCYYSWDGNILVKNGC